MTVYVILWQERNNWLSVFEDERDAASLAEAAVITHNEMPPEWQLISIQEKCNPYLEMQETDTA